MADCSFSLIDPVGILGCANVGAERNERVRTEGNCRLMLDD